MMMTITRHRYTNRHLSLFPLFDSQQGGMLWKETKATTGVGEPKGATSYWTGFLFSPINQLLHHRPPLAPPYCVNSTT